MNGFWSGRGVYGPSEMTWNISTTNLTHDDIVDITAAWRETMALAHEAILREGAFNWQMLAGTSIADGQATPENCLEYFRASCSPPHAVLDRPLLYYATINNPPGDPGAMLCPAQDLASFLLVRGKFAWLGTGWLGCGFSKKGANGGTCCSGDGTKCRPATAEGGCAASAAADGGFYARPREWDLDYGVPLGKCAETVPGSSGVFVREWSKARVSMDCNKWEAGFVWKN